MDAATNRMVGGGEDGAGGWHARCGGWCGQRVGLTLGARHAAACASVSWRSREPSTGIGAVSRVLALGEQKQAAAAGTCKRNGV